MSKNLVVNTWVNLNAAQFKKVKSIKLHKSNNAVLFQFEESVPEA